MNKKIKQMSGMTLIELLVALCLFSILMLLCDGIYLVGRRVTIEIKLQMEKFYRRALVFNFLNQSIQQAGFWGLHNALSGSTESGLNPMRIYHGNQAGWSPPLPDALKNRVAKGTDVLILEYSIAPWVQILQPALHHQPDGMIRAHPPWESGWFVLSDENRSMTFFAQVQRLGTQFTILFPEDIDWHESEPAILSRYERIAYYLREGEAGYDLMQKKLEPLGDAVHLIKGLSKWYWSDEGINLRLKWEDESEAFISFKKANA